MSETNERTPLRRPPSPPRAAPSLPSLFRPLFITVAALALALLSIITLRPAVAPPSHHSSAIRLHTSSHASERIEFAVIGDWGRLGDYHQNDTAGAMARVLRQRPDVQLIFSAGDNFYESGVASVADSQFHDSFERVYVHPTLQRLPWYVALGNHDHRGSVQAQIRYSYQSTRWNLPSNYFSIRLSTTTLAIVLDTTPLSDSSDGKNAREDPAIDPERQLIWLQSTLRLAPPNCRFFILGHHNMFSVSVADHQGDLSVRKSLEHILLPYASRIIAYVAGHEHALMHMKPYDGLLPPSQSFDHFVSGAGSELSKLVKPNVERAEHWLDCCNVLAETPNNKSFPHSEWSQSVNGFFIYRIQDDTFSAHAYDMKGRIVHQYQRSLAPLK